MEDKDLNNQHHADGMAPSSNSRSRRKPATRGHRWRKGRLNDAAMKNQKRIHPNAQKHGVFSVCPTFPGEDQQEFEELHWALIDEWRPSGPTEEDAVFSLADLMWRKCRAQKFVQAKLSAATYRSRSPILVENLGLILFGWFMRLKPETAFEGYANTFLTADNVSHLKQKFPRANYESTSEWAEAVIAEINSLLPRASAPKPRELEALAEIVNKITTGWQVADIQDHARAFFDDELNLRERLDAMIDRKVKHLMQLKAGKQMLRQTFALREDKPPKKIAARSDLQ